MPVYSRKQFLQTSAVLAAAFLGGTAFTIPAAAPLLSFSTLGCPAWSFQQIIDFAGSHGFKGIELRGILKQMDITQSPEFADAASISATLTLMKNKNLRFVNLGSSCNLHLADPVKRQENLEEAKRYIDLAEKIHCPYVRVFPNLLPKEQDKQVTIQLIVKGLQELGDYAKDKKVMVLMETHGDVVWSADLLQIMQAVNHPQTGLIWDITNMWTVTKEPPAKVYPLLKPYMHHTHIKDARLVNGEVQYTFMGKGEVPIFDAIRLLQKDAYKGFFSFEWEKRWHPELAEPELAVADYAAVMKKL
jgi:sugar phosphate isomerase/epimerase